MKIVVFTDLDGTLLDHSDYSFEAARPALNALHSSAIPLVLATSKTAAEVAELHAVLELGDAPAIVENGAGVFRPDGLKQAGVREADKKYQEIRTALNLLEPELRAQFVGFGDLDSAEISNLTGLSLPASRLAKERCFSEPGLWSGDQTQLDKFRQSLFAKGIHCRRGGRFLTLSFGRTKADALKSIAKELEATHIIALGDAPNDIEMLEAADTAFIVKNEHGAQIDRLAGEETGLVKRTDQEGPTGWNKAVLSVLADLGVAKGI